MNEKSVSFGAVAWSLPLAWAVHRNTGNTAEAGLWLLLGLWMAWRIWKDWPAGPQPPDNPWRIAALCCWTFCVWLVSGLWPQDHGFIKLMLPIMAVVLLIVLWGPRNLHKGWRVLLIAAFWVVDPFSFLIDRLLAGPRLESLTAGAASLGLWQTGIDVSRSGAQITTEAGSIIVKYACTAVPLWVLLFHLLVPAVIVLGLTWKRVVLLGIVCLVSGFLISVVRVMIIALVVNNDDRFLYWHGDEGAGWFTLAAFALFGITLIRQTPVTPAENRPRSFSPLTRYFLGAGMALSVLALGRMLAGGVPSYPSEISAPSKIGPWTLLTTDMLPLPPEHLPAAHPMWIKRFSYIEENTFGSLIVTAAPLPVWLDGDPLILASHWKLIPAMSSREPWKPVSTDAGGTVRILHRGNGWLAGIHRQGAIICESNSWIPLSKKLPGDIAAWFDWLGGRAPLRQKTGLWIALETGRGAPLTTDQAAAILSEWRDRYLNSNSTH